MPPGLRPRGILSLLGTLYPMEHSRSLSNPYLRAFRTRDIHRFMFYVWQLARQKTEKNRNAARKIVEAANFANFVKSVSRLASAVMK